MNDIGKWTDEQLRNASIYGICAICRAPREECITQNGNSVHMELICPNGHDQDSWP